MPDRNYSMTAIKIKILCALVVINKAANTFHNVDGVDWINVE
jgi:hypothetical protein